MLLLKQIDPVPEALQTFSIHDIKPSAWSEEVNSFESETRMLLRLPCRIFWAPGKNKDIRLVHTCYPCAVELNTVSSTSRSL